MKRVLVSETLPAAAAALASALTASCLFLYAPLGLRPASGSLAAIAALLLVSCLAALPVASWMRRRLSLRAEEPATAGAREREPAATAAPELDDVFESMADSVLAVDEQRRIVGANRAARELLGRGDEQLLGTSLDALLPPVGGSGRADGRRGTPADGVLHLDDGRELDVSVTSAPLRRGSGSVYVLRDIRERKETEASLRRAEARFRGLVEQAADAFFVFDTSGRITEVNREACRSLGYARRELVGTSLQSILSGFEDAEQKTLWARLGPEAAVTHERALRRKDGTEFPAEVRMSAVELGGYKSCLALARDVTERKKHERALIEARERALDASRLKSQFLANVSHEIRTPMNGIIGMTGLALESDLAPEPRGQLETIRSSADALLRLVDDLLDFSDIEAGRLRLRTTVFRTRDPVMEAVKPLAYRAHDKGLELVVDIDDDVPRAAVGDAARIRQVLVNLVGNAIKFTERGEVIVRVRVDDAGASKARFTFSVADTGIGIPAEKREEIFDVFAQVDGSSTRRFGGTGLGLALSSKLAQEMGGRLSVDSEPGRGSAFHLELPLSLPEQDGPAHPEPQRELGGIQALVIDANAASRSFLVRRLEVRGAAVRAVETAEGPELRADSAASLPRFEVALVDAASWDDLDPEGTRRLRAACRRIVLLTSPARARGGSSPEDEGLEVLAKPVEPEALYEAVRGSGPCLAVETPAPPSCALRILKVLVAEDNPVNSAVVERTLSKRGHEVKTVPDGRCAVEAVQAERFDLVLMDVQMPEMDGLQATRAIREWERMEGRHTPVVALTAHAMKGDRERCLEAGMDDYASKPIKPSSLVELVESVAGQVPAEVASEDGAHERLQDVELASVLDTESFLARIGDDPALLEEVIGLYFEETPQLVARLRAGLVRGDVEESRRAAHRLRGMLATMGAHSAQRIEAVENEIRDGRIDAASNLFRAFVSELERLDAALGALVAEHHPDGERVRA